MIVPVKKLTIITLQDIEEELIWNLGKLGAVQLKRLSEEDFLGFQKTSEEELHKYEELLDRFNTIYRSLCPESCEFVKKNIENLDIRHKINPVDLEEEISQYESTLAYLETELNRHLQRIKSLESIKETLSILKKFNINPQEIGTFAHLFSVVGIMKKENAELLREKFSKYTQVIFKTYELDKEEVLLFLTTLNELRPQILKILTAHEFSELKIPPEVPPKLDAALIWVDQEISKSKEEINELNEKREALKKDFLSNGYIIRRKLLISYKISYAQVHFLRSKLMVVMQGWVPSDRVDNIAKYIESMKGKLSGKIMYSFEDPREDESPPSVMKNPKMFKAYESLIRQYGSPSPTETDPTIIGGILWTIMFGLMFPDFGEGLVIVILGIIFSFVLKGQIMGIPAKKLGNLMIGMGLTAMFFGALIGEFFLTEVTPLWPGLPHGWLEHPEYILWLLKIAVFFGILEIILGLALNIRRNLRLGHRAEALFGEHGLAGLIGFIGIVILAFTFMGIRVFPELTLPFSIFGISAIPNIRFPKANILALTDLSSNWVLYISLGLIFLSVGLMIYKSIVEKEELISGFGMIYETILSFVTNMLSFARIAGFFIAHSALAMVVVKLLEYDLILGIGMGLIFLNFFALSLELIVVMIQSTRLLFYEFLTKFYEGNGSLFKPFRI
ncbi:MAG: V-type ATP synthase subunit I [Candidatus Asgardarchaeia archaeon]